MAIAASFGVPNSSFAFSARNRSTCGNAESSLCPDLVLHRRVHRPRGERDDPASGDTALLLQADRAYPLVEGGLAGAVAGLGRVRVPRGTRRHHHQVPLTAQVGRGAQERMHAIPQAQKSCSLDFRSNTVGTGWTWAGSSVVVKNGNTPRYVVVNFNADANVDTGAEIRIGYRIDLGSITTPGAEHFASEHTPRQQMRHSMVVLLVRAGQHTIRPYWRVVGPAGKHGYLDNRCLTAEASTS